MFYPEQLHTLAGPESLSGMSDRDFEYCCKYLLEGLRYGKAFVTRKGPRGGDGGVDLMLYADDGSVFAYVQCKLWRGRHTGYVKPIRELAGCMAPDDVRRGYFIVTAPANSYEREEARRRNITLIDRIDFARMLETYRHGGDAGA